MSKDWLKSVVLITSNDPATRDFGIGFVIHREGQITYILTCANVVEAIGGSATVKVNDIECSALTSPIRLKRALSDYPAIPALWSEAEQLAQQYEYNDYFTSLYLTQGHLIWDGLLPEWESGFDLALPYYQLALIHALRFNRFLLDEAL